MHFFFGLLALLPVLALAAPSGVTQQLENRQGGVADKCGSKTYTASQVNQAIRNALSGKYDSSGYPHTYNVSISVLLRDGLGKSLLTSILALVDCSDEFRTMKVCFGLQRCVERR